MFRKTNTLAPRNSAHLKTLAGKQKRITLVTSHETSDNAA